MADQPSPSSPPNSPTGKEPSASVKKKKPDDFIFGKIIGEGSYSTVFLAKEVNTEKEYAIKVLEKKHIIREKKTPYVMREREVFSRLNHPFFVRLYFTFQDADRLYFGLSYARRGELLTYINKLGCFDENCTRFYSAEVILALEHLHSLGIIHRDLKPENILLNSDMHIQITDFGSAKILNENNDDPQNSSQRRNSFVGTAQYVSPEVLTSKDAYHSSDLWALGCIVYQLLSGELPFYGGHEYQIFQKITRLDYEFPDGFNSTAKNLVEKLLVLDPKKRLGCGEMGGYDPLKAHSFFKGIEWETLDKQKPPELHPYLPAKGADTEYWSQYKPGMDDQHMSRLISMGIQQEPELLATKNEASSPDVKEAPKEKEKEKPNEEKEEKKERESTSSSSSSSSASTKRKPNSFCPLCRISDDDKKQAIEKQRRENDYHRFVEGNFIIKQGLVDKRKGLFSRRRMLLMTEGPHLYYVDPQNMVLKGQIPWSKELKPEAKNFKIYFVHTPNRTYYLEDPEGNALKWCKRIEEVWNHYYGDET